MHSIQSKSCSEAKIKDGLMQTNKKFNLFKIFSRILYSLLPIKLIQNLIFIISNQGSIEFDYMIHKAFFIILSGFFIKFYFLEYINLNEMLDELAFNSNNIEEFCVLSKKENLQIRDRIKLFFRLFLGKNKIEVLLFWICLNLQIGLLLIICYDSFSIFDILPFLGFMIFQNYFLLFPNCFNLKRVISYVKDQNNLQFILVIIIVFCNQANLLMYIMIFGDFMISLEDDYSNILRNMDKLSETNSYLLDVLNYFKIGIYNHSPEEASQYANPLARKLFFPFYNKISSKTSWMSKFIVQKSNLDEHSKNTSASSLKEDESLRDLILREEKSASNCGNSKLKSLGYFTYRKTKQRIYEIYKSPYNNRNLKKRGMTL